MDINKTRKKRNPDQILFTFKNITKCQNTSFLQNESTNIKKQRAHMPFFLIQKSQAHTPTFILFVKLCKKPIFVKKTTLAVFPPARTLVIET